MTTQSEPPSAIQGGASVDAPANPPTAASVVTAAATPNPNAPTSTTASHGDPSCGASASLAAPAVPASSGGGWKDKIRNLRDVSGTVAQKEQKVKAVKSANAGADAPTTTTTAGGSVEAGTTAGISGADRTRLHNFATTVAADAAPIRTTAVSKRPKIIQAVDAIRRVCDPLPDAPPASAPAPAAAVGEEAQRFPTRTTGGKTMAAMLSKSLSKTSAVVPQASTTAAAVAIEASKSPSKEAAAVVSQTTTSTKSEVEVSQPPPSQPVASAWASPSESIRLIGATKRTKTAAPAATPTPVAPRSLTITTVKTGVSIDELRARRNGTLSAVSSTSSMGSLLAVPNMEDQQEIMDDISRALTRYCCLSGTGGAPVAKAEDGAEQSSTDTPFSTIGNPICPEVQLYNDLMELCRTKDITPNMLELLRELLKHTRVIPQPSPATIAAAAADEATEEEGALRAAALAASGRRVYVQQIIMVVINKIREQKLQEERGALAGAPEAMAQTPQVTSEAVSSAPAGEEKPAHCEGPVSRNPAAPVFATVAPGSSGFTAPTAASFFGFANNITAPMPAIAPSYGITNHVAGPTPAVGSYYGFGNGTVAPNPTPFTQFSMGCPNWNSAVASNSIHFTQFPTQTAPQGHSTSFPMGFPNWNSTVAPSPTPFTQFPMGFPNWNSTVAPSPTPFTQFPMGFPNWNSTVAPSPTNFTQFPMQTAPQGHSTSFPVGIPNCKVGDTVPSYPHHTTIAAGVSVAPPTQPQSSSTTKTSDETGSGAAAPADARLEKESSEVMEMLQKEMQEQQHVTATSVTPVRPTMASQEAPLVSISSAERHILSAIRVDFADRLRAEKMSPDAPSPVPAPIAAIPRELTRKSIPPTGLTPGAPEAPPTAGATSSANEGQHNFRQVPLFQGPDSSSDVEDPVQEGAGEQTEEARISGIITAARRSVSHRSADGSSSQPLPSPSDLPATVETTLNRHAVPFVPVPVTTGEASTDGALNAHAADFTPQGSTAAPTTRVTTFNSHAAPFVPSSDAAESTAPTSNVAHTDGALNAHAADFTPQGSTAAPTRFVTTFNYHAAPFVPSSDAADSTEPASNVAHTDRALNVHAADFTSQHSTGFYTTSTTCDSQNLSACPTTLPSHWASPDFFNEWAQTMQSCYQMLQQQGNIELGPTQEPKGGATTATVPPTAASTAAAPNPHA